MTGPSHLNRTNGPFGRLPYDAIDRGVLVAMKGKAGELAVYIAIAAHVQQKGWTAWPSIDRLAILTGLDRRTVQRVIRRLTEKGLIAVQEGGGKGVVNTYELITGGGVMNAAVSRPQRAATSTSKGRRSRIDTAASEPPNCGVDVATRKEEEKKRRKRQPDRVDGIDRDLVSALKAAGVRNQDVIDELAAMSGITADHIATALDKAKSKANGDPTGLLVKLLRDRDWQSPSPETVKRATSEELRAKGMIK